MSTSAAQRSLIYVPVDALKPVGVLFLPCIHCSQCLRARIERIDVLTSSLMHFLTFLRAHPAVWICPTLGFPQRDHHSTAAFTSSCPRDKHKQTHHLHIMLHHLHHRISYDHHVKIACTADEKGSSSKIALTVISGFAFCLRSL